MANNTAIWLLLATKYVSWNLLQIDSFRLSALRQLSACLRFQILYVFKVVFNCIHEQHPINTKRLYKIYTNVLR